MDKQKTKTSTWIIGGLFTLVIVAGLASANHEATCPGMDAILFGLPDDKAEAKTDFLAKAERLRKQGICPVEGSFGRGYNKFYFAVHNAGHAKKLYHLRFTREELRK